MKDSNFLFVYGTLKKGFDNEIAKYLHTTQKFMGEAYFPGTLFKVSYYPGAVYNPQLSTLVHGHLFRITHQKRELFKRLDYYEGIDQKHNTQAEYVREIVPVTYLNNQIQAWIYLYNQSYSQFPVIKSGWIE